MQPVREGVGRTVDEATVNISRPNSDPAGDLPVLMYHSIGSGASRAFRRWQVERHLFAEQLTALREAGYRLVGMSEALADLGTTGSPGRTVAVTFDDAFRDFADAAEVLRAAGATATLYVPTAHVGGRASWLAGYQEADLRTLDWPELVELAGAGTGVEIGSHGHAHAELDVLPADRMRADVQTSRTMLSERLGVPVYSFCYPFGYHTTQVRAAVAAAGFTSACEVGYRVQRTADDRFAIGRLIVTGDTRPERMAGLVRDGQNGIGVGLRRRTRTAWRACRTARHRVTRRGASKEVAA
jgi:peptidoglycan/xylan/chitin deacetylase (PgdA/CDA1 family)